MAPKHSDDIDTSEAEVQEDFGAAHLASLVPEPGAPVFRAPKKLFAWVQKGLKTVESTAAGKIRLPFVVSMDVYDASFLNVYRFERVFNLDCDHVQKVCEEDAISAIVGDADQDMFTELWGRAWKHKEWACLGCGAMGPDMKPVLVRQGWIVSPPFGSEHSLGSYPACVTTLETCELRALAKAETFKVQHPHLFPWPAGMTVTIPCQFCGKEPSGTSFKRCAACNVATYSSPICERLEGQPQNLVCAVPETTARRNCGNVSQDRTSYSATEQAVCLNIALHWTENNIIFSRPTPHLNPAPIHSISQPHRNFLDRTPTQRLWLQPSLLVLFDVEDINEA